MSARVPDGYVPVVVGPATGLAELDAAAALHDVLADATLYDWAARHPERRAFSGRLPAYSVPFADGGRVVVRHSHHGGTFGRLTRDLFVAPTRAPHELRAALRLRDAGVRTPSVAAYVVYAAGPLLRRSDVATHEVPRARDLAEALADRDAAARVAALGATAALMTALAAAGARHPDFNIKNVLVADGGRASDTPDAWVLDVDRVVFDQPGGRRVGRANFDRLARSARKWRANHGVRVTDAELEELARMAGVSA